MKRRIPLIAAALFLTTSGLAGAASKIEDGKQVTLAYALTVDGTLLEKADAEHPFVYTHGKNQLVPGLEKNLSGLQIGEKKAVKVLPEEGFGPKDPQGLQEVQKKDLPSDVTPEVGTFLEARNREGERRLVRIVEVKDQSVVVDFNHPLAGKELEFQVEVLKIS